MSALAHLSPGPDLRVVKASQLVEPDARRGRLPPTTGSSPPLWSREELVGRLTELCGSEHSGHLTLAGSLVQQFQAAGEPVAWVTTTKDTFFPPDLAATGVDLAALPVIRLTDPVAATTVTDRLIRSGSFGLVILELVEGSEVPAAILGKLVRLARQQEASLVCLTITAPNVTTLGSMVSLRGTIFREQEGRHGVCGVVVQKDRQRAPGYRLSYQYRAPHGVC
jgi:recombination protein RecA